MRGLGSYPKSIRAQFRALIALAHERDQAAALEALAQHFDAWRAGRLDPFELNQLIHEYHHGPSREIWKRYDDPDPEACLAHAIVRGVIRGDEVSPELMGIVGQLVESIRAWDDDPDEVEEAEELDW